MWFSSCCVVVCQCDFYLVVLLWVFFLPCCLVVVDVILLSCCCECVFLLSVFLDSVVGFVNYFFSLIIIFNDSFPQEVFLKEVMLNFIRSI